jgi:hypothetical protein
MNQHRPDFLSAEVKAADLVGWTDVLPERYRILGANLFADIFLADAAGAVHMLEVSAGLVTRIYASEEEFRQRCVDDEEGWLLRPLADRCRLAGLILTADQCYAFTMLPVFGGEYETNNIWMSAWREWIGFTASIYAQTRDSSDGTKVRFKIVD